MQCEPALAVFGREFVTTVFIVPWLVARALRGRPVLPAQRDWGHLLAASLLIQVVANLCIQWALGVVGLAVAIPAMFGASIAGGAVLGRLALGERVSLRTATAIVLLIASLVLLSLGAEKASFVAGKGSDFRTGENGTVPFLDVWIVAGVAAAVLAGAIVALLNTVIRRSITGSTPPCAVAFWTPLMGVVAVGPIAALRWEGPASLGVSPSALFIMLAAGLLNCAGFLALIRGLRRTAVVQANVLSASQVALAAAAGMALFREPPNVWLLAGVCLTIVGIARIGRNSV